MKPGMIGSPKKDKEFQLLLKGCTIEAKEFSRWSTKPGMFQLLLKGCTIEAVTAYVTGVLSE